jgi:hypothetical protein
MRESIPPLSNTPSRHGAQLNHKDNFTFTFNRALCINIKVKLSLCFFLTELHAMKAYWRNRVTSLPPIIQPVAKGCTTDLSRLHALKQYVYMCVCVCIDTC